MKALKIAFALLFLLPPLAHADEAEVLRIRSHLEAVEAELRAVPAPTPETQERRDLQLDRLRAYHQRGLFPFNDLRDERIPIFIDSNGTACAVAHLLIEDGQRDLAEDIDKHYHDAYLREMEVPAVGLWAAGAGLRVGELARIQPTYDPQEELVPFYEACDAGSVGSMEREFVQVKAYAAASGTRLLHAVDVCLTRAAAGGHVRAARWALDAGASANRSQGSSWAGTGDPLQSAFMSGDRATVKLLVDRGATPEGRSDNLLSWLVEGEEPGPRLELYATFWPLDLATPSALNTQRVHRLGNLALKRPDRVENLRVVLAAGLSPLAVNPDGFTLLDLAVLRRSTTLADALTVWSEAPSLPAVEAARSGSLEEFSATFAGGGDSLQARWLLQEAVAAGNVVVVEDLLRSGTAPRPPAGRVRLLDLAVDRRATPSMLRALVEAERAMDDPHTPLPFARLVEQNGVTEADKARYQVLLDALRSPRFASHRDRELGRAIQHLQERCGPGDLEYMEVLLEDLYTNILAPGQGPCGAPIAAWRSKRLAEEIAKAEAAQVPPSPARKKWSPEEDADCSCETGGSLALLPLALLARRRRT